MTDSDSSSMATRADRWLWAARAFKTRALAAAACDGGKVTINGITAKPHKLIRPGDEVVISTRDGKRILRVVGLAERRGPASQAQALYDDHSPAPPPREPYLAPRRDPGSGRPTKRERRHLRRGFD
ncbi:MAG: RNA-binding S4 domain-containing protein [Deltaproteobacteria bacterium]|nr:RNA-binding S4 domain-containing protein [Deltaproteobacteria bacterium]